MNACRTRASRQAAARRVPFRRESCVLGCRTKAAPSLCASQREHWLAPQHACAPRRTHTTGLRDNTSRRLRVMRRSAGATMRLGAGTTMRSRCRLVVVMRHNYRLRRRWWWRRRWLQRDHASSAALGTYFGCPAQKPARHVPTAFAARTPSITGVRPGTGRQRRRTGKCVDRAKRQRADGQDCKCSSV